MRGVQLRSWVYGFVRACPWKNIKKKTERELELEKENKVKRRLFIAKPEKKQSNNNGEFQEVVEKLGEVVLDGEEGQGKRKGGRVGEGVQGGVEEQDVREIEDVTGAHRWSERNKVTIQVEENVEGSEGDTIQLSDCNGEGLRGVSESIHGGGRANTNAKLRTWKRQHKDVEGNQTLKCVVGAKRDERERNDDGLDPMEAEYSTVTKKMVKGGRSEINVAGPTEWALPSQ